MRDSVNAEAWSMDEKQFGGGFFESDGKEGSGILSCIDEGLSVFGKEIPMTMRFHLENKYHVTPKIIIHDPKRFVAGLREIFGSGSKLVEGRIAKLICRKYGLPESDDLVEAIHQARHLESA